MLYLLHFTQNEVFMTPEKTQTIRVCGEVHRLAKTEAAKNKIGLQIWIENLVKKECKDKK
jgi:predicted HicB family RNase H-like nuclease